jgi:hypothetical protein
LKSRLSTSSYTAASIRSATIDTGLESDNDSLYMDPTPNRHLSQTNDGKLGQPRAKAEGKEIHRVYRKKGFADLEAGDKWEDEQVRLGEGE